jgi:hypothetical protein
MAMPRWAILAGGTLLFLVLLSQFLLPPLASRAVEDRLTEGGGTAEVTLEAVPAVRLLFTDGERFEIAAERLDLDLDEQIDVFDRLDGFADVAISIDDSRAGPFDLDTLELHRDGPEPYSMTSTGTVDPGELAAFGADSLGLPGGGLAGLALETLLGETSSVPVRLDVQLSSSGGDTEVVEGDATVAGIPAGPLAELIASAVVARL